jgi:hypothetical protein
MMSIWDSMAKQFMFAPGARQGPVANGCSFGPWESPYDIRPEDLRRRFGMS